MESECLLYTNNVMSELLGTKADIEQFGNNDFIVAN